MMLKSLAPSYDAMLTFIDVPREWVLSPQRGDARGGAHGRSIAGASRRPYACEEFPNQMNHGMNYGGQFDEAARPQAHSIRNRRPDNPWQGDRV